MDIALLRECVGYNPDTGLMRWKKVMSNRAAPGDICGGNIDSKGYARVCFNRKQYRAHRVVWALFYGVEPEGQIDHINGDRLDNRIANLRLATNAENSRNVRIGKNNSSGVTGVTFHATAKKWMAQIAVDRKNIYLGLHENKDAAVAARKAAEQKYFGAFAPTHFEMQ